MPRRDVKYLDIVHIKGALRSLRTAREQLREGGASRAAAAVGRTIKSAEGALNHAEAIWTAKVRSTQPPV